MLNCCESLVLGRHKEMVQTRLAVVGQWVQMRLGTMMSSVCAKQPDQQFSESSYSMLTLALHTFQLLSFPLAERSLTHSVALPGQLTVAERGESWKLRLAWEGASKRRFARDKDDLIQSVLVFCQSEKTKHL